MESEIQTVESEPGVDDHIISLLGGLVAGATVWVLGIGFVGVMKAAASTTGIIVLDVLDSAKLVPPPGIDLSNIIIKLPLPEGQLIDIVFVAFPLLFGFLAAWVGYRKILKLE